MARGKHVPRANSYARRRIASATSTKGADAAVTADLMPSITTDLMTPITTDLAWSSLSLIRALALLINARIRLDIRLASWNAAQ